MPEEFNLEFPSENQVIVHFNEQHSDKLDFQSPVTEEDQKDIRWYLEVYAYLYTTDVDDKRAAKIAARLPILGESLLKAVCYNDKVAELLQQFHRQANVGRLLTISASHPAILSLPWELLRFQGKYLFHDQPRISIRRRLANLDTAKKPLEFTAKKRLHLLFVVSRPQGAGFIDPRADPIAVLDALAQTGRIIEVEFLRPATLANLRARLEDKTKPSIDILHFDGHGAFNAEESMGYLLFTRQGSWTEHRVPAKGLGLILGSANIPLVILSACQSAAIGDSEEPMGTVAVQLTHAGVASVIAMTHSVHVNATRALFSAFYQHLTQSKGVGEALDNARSDLYQNPERIELQRGQEHVTLKLYDWFLPALYQAGEDTPLLLKETKFVEETRFLQKSNLPKFQKAGFWGRTFELWQIECAFVQDGTRRFTISGFGGQGKTYLAIEAGLWLQRTGLFANVCFVDYAAFQGVDAVGWAVSTLATVLDKSLVDVQAATAALAQQPTLLILDNLEDITTESLSELLTVAKKWSEIGECRVLLTTRSPDFHHPDYPTKGIHQSLALDGLTEYDALAYFQRLLKLPPVQEVELPKREVVLALFQQVNYHPLSIGLVVEQLKVREITELGNRLEKFLAETPDNPLLASLNLSLDRLDEEARRLLPKLGVFQGGALLYNLSAITEFSESQGQYLLSTLISVGLIQAEYLGEDLGGNIIYFKFHPTLAPTLWVRLTTEEQAQLQASHRQRYYEMSGYLYFEDIKNPHETRVIIQRELPNLMFAVHGALDAKETYAVEFVRNVNLFLNVFGLNHDSKVLSQRIEHLDDLLVRSNKGEQLYRAGQYQAAAQAFSEILEGLGEQTNYEHSLTLLQLGRCFKEQGQAAQAVEYYRQGLDVAEQLELDEDVTRQLGVLQVDLADALIDMGDYDGAKKTFESALYFLEEINDHRSIGVINGQLGTIALRQGNRLEAEMLFREAISIFQRLNEPEHEAIYLYQLGVVYQETMQWDAADHAYREVARINESQANLADAAQTWNNLATVTEGTGKPEEAEAWYRKAIEGAKTAGNNRLQALISFNLANLLQTHYPNRLQEAQQLAEEALAIEQKLDPAAAKIWKTYDILTVIADKQNNPTKASEYRRQSREAYQGIQRMEYHWQQLEPSISNFITTVVTAVDDAEVRNEIESIHKKIGTDNNLAVAIRHIWDGERDEAVLCEPLNYKEAAIINAILRGIAGEV